MNAMKPIASQHITDREAFVYEVKYDGFRAQLIWTKNGIQLLSRNDVNLTNQFPEIVATCKRVHHIIKAFLPLVFDGELVVLNNKYEANFPLIQWRGRLKNTDKITTAAKLRPATFLAFDLIKYNGNEVTDQPYEYRKKVLKNVMNAILNAIRSRVFDYVDSYQNDNALWEMVADYRGEGIVAKRTKSKYSSGKQHHDWFKIKNWRTIRCFLTFYNPNNGYFTVAVFRKGEIIQIGKCKHGLNDDELNTVKELFRTNGKQTNDGFELPPAICAEIHTLDLYQHELREPEFVGLLPNIKAEECTYDRLQLDLAMMPPSISLSNIEKVYWPQIPLTKGNLLIYLRTIFPYIIPFLMNRVLTIIRCPDGVEAECFYQKSLPNTAPKSMKKRDDEAMICNDCDSLVWLANLGAVEYHVPFQTADQMDPTEIVFDLDPPHRKQFSLAIKATLLIKQLLDNIELTSFVKTSGNKGLQIHIPLPSGVMTYEDTAVFTEAIAKTLVRKHPNLFTIERLKKNRKNRLYIDYVQHGKGKTIIAPYSPRKTTDATVATPLFWHELKPDLSPDQFTIDNVMERIKQMGCPFDRYAEQGENQQMNQLLAMIRS